MAEAVAPAAPATRSPRWLAAPLLAFALVSLTAGLLARHSPRSKGYFRLFCSDPVHRKAGFATVVVVLACFQLFTAAWIFRKLPWSKPAWVNPVHRWSGRLAFAFTLPVAYHCIFKLGFQKTDSRVLTHSFLGCAFYGAFAGKVLIDGSKQRKEKHPAAARVSGQDRSARRAGSVHTQPDCDGTARPPPCGARCR